MNPVEFNLNHAVSLYFILPFIHQFYLLVDIVSGLSVKVRTKCERFIEKRKLTKDNNLNL